MSTVWTKLDEDKVYKIKIYISCKYIFGNCFNNYLNILLNDTTCLVLSLFLKSSKIVFIIIIIIENLDHHWSYVVVEKLFGLVGSLEKLDGKMFRFFLQIPPQHDRNSSVVLC